MRIGIGLALAALLWAPVACQRKRPEGANTRLATTVLMNDPRAAGQLVSGFYDIEDGAWRWTSQQFTVELATPIGAAVTGATLILNYTVPPVVIQKNGSVTLTASVDGTALAPPETISTPGEHVFRRDVPANLLGATSVKAKFELDKAMTPEGADQRVLGLVASSVALQRK